MVRTNSTIKEVACIHDAPLIAKLFPDVWITEVALLVENKAGIPERVIALLDGVQAVIGVSV